MNELEYNAILGSFVPTRLHLKINEQEIEESIKGDIEFEDRKVLTTIHELVHFYQTAMTGYGQDTWNLYRQSVAGVFNDWLQSTSSSKKRILPIAYLAKESLEGLANALKIQMLGKDVLLLLNLLNRCDSGLKNLKQLNMPQYQQEYDLVPIININGEQYRVNGIDVIESHAKYLEGFYAENYLGISKEKILNRDILPKEYFYIYDWFIDTVGKGAYLDFPIICELALQITYNPIIKTQEEWKKMHPAWRFIELTNALKEIGVKSFDSLKEVRDKYSEYQEKLYEYCGYETLEANLGRMMDRYSVRCQGCNPLAVESRMKDLLALKQEIGWFAANPFLDRKIWEQVKQDYTVPLAQYGDRLEVIPYVKDENIKDGIMLESIIELHLQALASQILGCQSKYLIYPTDLQCGFAYFGLKSACAYQVMGKCSGNIDIDNDTLVGISFEGEEIIGCSFEAFAMANGIGGLENIEVKGYREKIPTYEELIRRVKNGVL